MTPSLASKSPAPCLSNDFPWRSQRFTAANLNCFNPKRHRVMNCPSPNIAVCVSPIFVITSLIMSVAVEFHFPILSRRQRRWCFSTRIWLDVPQLDAIWWVFASTFRFVSFFSLSLIVLVLLSLFSLFWQLKLCSIQSRFLSLSLSIFFPSYFIVSFIEEENSNQKKGGKRKKNTRMLAHFQQLQLLTWKQRNEAGVNESESLHFFIFSSFFCCC